MTRGASTAVLLNGTRLIIVALFAVCITLVLMMQAPAAIPCAMTRIGLGSPIRVGEYDIEMRPEWCVLDSSSADRSDSEAAIDSYTNRMIIVSRLPLPSLRETNRIVIWAGRKLPDGACDAALESTPGYAAPEWARGVQIQRDGAVIEIAEPCITAASAFGSAPLLRAALDDIVSVSHVGGKK